MSGWQQVAICLNCKEVVTDQVPFGSLFHVHMEVCPHCGHPKDRPGLERFFSGWRVVTARKVGDGWFKGWHWEFQDQGVLDGNHESADGMQDDSAMPPIHEAEA